MADPVEQIFLQSQAGSADGAGFGEFFQRGQEIEQQKQKLDIERQGMRIAKATLGINRREEEAKQLLLLAESEQDTLFTQNYAYWISQGADKKHIPQLMGLVNGTTKGNKVVNDFFERVGGINDIENDKKKRDAIREEEIANFPTPEQQTEAKRNIISLLGADANISINSKGEVFGSSPTGKTVTSRFNTKTGVWETIETTGSPLGDFSAAGQNAAQTIIQNSEQLRGAIAKTRQLAVGGNVGIQGAAKRMSNKFFAPLYEAFTGKSALFASVEELDNNVAEMQLSIMSSLKPDAQMSEKELAILARMFPTAGISDTAEGLNIKLDHIERLNNMRDYLHRRNNGMIPERQFFERMLDQPNGNKQISTFLSDLREAGLMSDNEIRVSIDRIRAIRESR